MTRLSTTKKIQLLGAFLLSSLALNLPAQSTLLHGYLEEKAPTHSDSISGAAEIRAQEVPLANSFPAAYQGAWHCVTTVVDSAVAAVGGVPAVTVGQTMLSDVAFVKQPDGRIVAKWNQPGWTESQATITTFSKTDARVDRTNYYVAEGMEQSWAARSRDQFSQTDRDSMVAKSYVDQYVDGQFAGRYHTTSVLQKQPDIASAR